MCQTARSMLQHGLVLGGVLLKVGEEHTRNGGKGSEGFGVGL